MHWLAKVRSASQAVDLGDRDWIAVALGKVAACLEPESRVRNHYDRSESGKPINNRWFG